MRIRARRTKCSPTFSMRSAARAATTSTATRRRSDPAGKAERARPLLGTLVSIRVGGTARREANLAIDTGFDAVAAVHRLMSFHESGSDVSRLNGDAFDGAVAVDSRTMTVLRRALNLSAASR